jgi:hypothetical protein
MESAELNRCYTCVSYPITQDRFTFNTETSSSEVVNVEGVNGNKETTYQMVPVVRA